MIGFVRNTLRSSPILRSSAGIMVLTLGAKVLGYAEKITLAYYFGTGYQVDVYNLVIAIVLSVFIFFREVIEPGYLNSFLRAVRDGDGEGAWGLFNAAARGLFGVTLLLTVFVFFFPGAVVDAFAPGFTGPKRELAVEAVRLVFPACVFLALSALTNITLNGLKKFALPASGELAFKAVGLAALVGLYQYWGLQAALLGVVGGAFAKLLIHLLALRRHLSLGSVRVDPAYVRGTWQLTWPLLIGVSFSQVSSLVDNLFASYLQEGAISALSYSRKVVELPILVFPYILSVVIFPYFSELALARDRGQLAALLSQSLAWITVVFLPLSVFFFTFSLDLVEVMFMRGAFDGHSAVLTARPLAFYALGMIFFAVETVLVIFYYANSDTRTPIFVGIGCVLLNLVLTYAAIRTIGYAGIALALVVSKGTKVVILLLLLKRSMTIQYRAVSAFLYRLVPAGAVLGLTLLAVSYALHDALGGSPVEKALFLAVAFGAGGLAYAGTLLLFRFKGTPLVNKAVLK